MASAPAPIATPVPAGGASYANANNAPLISTSGASRAQYADNVTKLNAANANIATSAAPTPRYSTGADGVQYVYNSPDGKGGFYSGPVATAPKVTPASDTTKPTLVTTPPANPTNPAPTDTNGTGDKPSKTADPNKPDLSMFDPGTASQIQSSLDQQDQSISAAKDTLTAATATLQNDPAAAAAAAAIAAKYDILIRNMQEKNRQVLGSYNERAARTGGLQYTGDMTDSFMSAEMDKANQRVADLVAQEQSLILRSNQAYKSGDVKAFAAAQNALDKANNDKMTALDKLLTATNNHVKTVQAAAKADSTAANQKIQNDIRLSTSLAQGVVAAIRESGVTDEKQIDKYINDTAAANGISNPAVLRSAYDKAALSTKNTESIIQNRGKTKSSSKKGGGTDGGYTYTPEDISTYTSLMNKGGTSPDGTKFNGRGTDTYVDPGTYVAAYNDWIKQGGTPQGFLKKFPITNVNPTSIPNLPAGLQPKAKGRAS